jgi:hypothetical protein
MAEKSGTDGRTDGRMQKLLMRRSQNYCQHYLSFHKSTIFSDNHIIHFTNHYHLTEVTQVPREEKKDPKIDINNAKKKYICVLCKINSFRISSEGVWVIPLVNVKKNTRPVKFLIFEKQEELSSDLKLLFFGLESHGTTH